MPTRPMIFSSLLLLAVGRNAKMLRMGPKMKDHVLHANLDMGKMSLNLRAYN